MKKIILPYILIIILLISIIPFQAHCDAEKEQEEVWNIGDIPVSRYRDISSCWNPHTQRFIIVGGGDYNGDNPGHTHFIITTDGKNLDIIEKYDSDRETGIQSFTSVAVCPNENYALITSLDGSLWKLEDRYLTKINYDFRFELYEVIWEPNGDYALIGSRFHIWRYENESIIEIDSMGKGLFSASWSPNGEYLLFTYGVINEIGRYNGEEVKVLSYEYLFQSSNSSLNEFMAHTVSFSPVREYAIITTSTSQIYTPYTLFIGFNGTGFSIISSKLEFSSTIYWSPNGSIALINSFHKPLIFEGGYCIRSCNISFNITLIDWSPECNLKIGIGGNETIGYGIISWGYLSSRFFPDSDNDGFIDDIDKFPEDPFEWNDTDDDGIGDNSDLFPEDPFEWNDTDDDGIGDNNDVFPDDPTEWEDTDGDGYGDNNDHYPENPHEWIDSDGDGYGDNCDRFPQNSLEWNDSDNDEIGDNQDIFPMNHSEWCDTDKDGIGDNSDAFPYDPSASEDSDGDGFPDRWNNGKSEKDSNMELKLDKYPYDPLRYEEENDNFSTAIILIIISLLIIFGFLAIFITKQVKKMQK